MSNPARRKKLMSLNVGKKEAAAPSAPQVAEKPADDEVDRQSARKARIAAKKAAAAAEQKEN